MAVAQTAYAYNLNSAVTTTNSNTISPYTQGVYTYPVMGGTVTSTITGPNAASYTFKESGMDTELIEALFALKPKLRKKYKNDKVAFRRDVLAAAKAQEQSGALEKLSPLLSIEA